MAHIISNPYACEGKWFRGNLHTHTTNSDGGMSPAQVAAFYEHAGYDFLSVTDHAVVTDMTPFRKRGFLTIPGVEIHTPDMVALNPKGPVGPQHGLQNEIDTILEQGGLPIIAHPYWSGLKAAQVTDAEAYVGLEIYNFICQTLNGKGYSLTYWDEALAAGKRVWGFAVDDAHLSDKYPGGAQGWIMARARQLTLPDIMESVQCGAFYSSNGPEIFDVSLTEGQVHVSCSAVERIHFVAQAGLGSVVPAPTHGVLTHAEYDLRGREQYLRIECVDFCGRTAWSNPLFAED